MSPSSQCSSDKLVKVGFIRRRHGLKGAVIVASLTDWPEERFAPGSQMLLSAVDGTEDVEVESAAPYKDAWLIRFHGIETPEGAASLKGAYLCIRDEDRASLEDDEFYEDQLLGMQVVSPSGKVLGKIRDVVNMPAHPILELDTHLSIPFLRRFVESIDPKKREIILNQEF